MTQLTIRTVVDNSYNLHNRCIGMIKHYQLELGTFCRPMSNPILETWNKRVDRQDTTLESTLDRIQLLMDLTDTYIKAETPWSLYYKNFRNHLNEVLFNLHETMEVLNQEIQTLYDMDAVVASMNEVH